MGTMLVKDQSVSIRPIESSDDFAETRLEAVGFVFHGTIPQGEGKRPGGKAGANLLHFARCAKLDKVHNAEAKIWFRTIRHAKQHLDEAVGADKWKWCKICEKEVTQRILNEV
jgi:hypothetical protein